jgi:hypothetical protein
MILNCPPISGKRIEIMKENIFLWLLSPALEELAAAFGGNLPKNLPLADLADWYLNFSERWDFRSAQKQSFDSKVGEGVRWLLRGGYLTQHQKESALNAAESLGLMNNSSPAMENYDYVLVLGGAKLSCLLRSRLAHNVITEKKMKPKAVALLASLRPIGDSEKEATKTYAPDAQTEFDLFVSAAKQEFEFDPDFAEDGYCGTNANNSWVIREYMASDYKIFIIAAPSSNNVILTLNSANEIIFLPRLQQTESTKKAHEKYRKEFSKKNV